MAQPICQQIFIGEWYQISPSKRTSRLSVDFHEPQSPHRTFHDKGRCPLCDGFKDLFGDDDEKPLGGDIFEVMIEELCLQRVAAVHIRLNRRAISFQLGTQYGSIASKAFPYTVPLHDPTSPQAWQFIKSCIGECDAHHGSKCARRVTAFPRRVIDVEDPEISPDVKLQFWDEATERDSYIALSYCWGTGSGYHQLTTTSDSFEKHRKKINLSDLSQTIQDAITVTRNLGQRYLWVDALCIIQDSDEDKKSQMAIMGEIYSSAYLTISAVGASGCDKGFLTSQQDPYFEVPYRASDGCIYRMLMVRSDEENKRVQCAITQGSPLNERGWCFQETILSSRILFFTNIQPYWRCAHSSKHAGGMPFKIFFSTTGIWQIQVRVKDIIRTGSVAPHWLSIALLYSKRMFTNWDDRQPAIISLAKRLQSYTGDKYLAGHWRSSFIPDLLWAPRKYGGSEQERPLSDYPGTKYDRSSWSAPSWSWMSFHGPINYHNLEPNPDIKAKVLTELQSDEFGRITNGPLHISGPIKQVLVPEISDWNGNLQRPPSVPCYDIALSGKQPDEVTTDSSRYPPPIGSVSFDDFDPTASLDQYWSLETILTGSANSILFVANRSTTFFGLVLQPISTEDRIFRRVGELCASLKAIEYFEDAQNQAIYIV